MLIVRQYYKPSKLTNYIIVQFVSASLFYFASEIIMIQVFIHVLRGFSSLKSKWNIKKEKEN